MILEVFSNLHNSVILFLGLLICISARLGKKYFRLATKCSLGFQMLIITPDSGLTHTHKGTTFMAIRNSSAIFNLKYMKMNDLKRDSS